MTYLLSGAQHQTISLMVMNTNTSLSQDNCITQLQAISCNLDLIVPWFLGDQHGFSKHRQIHYKYTFDMWWIECAHSSLLFDKCQITQGAWIPRYTNLGGGCTVTPPFMGGRRYPFLCIVEIRNIAPHLCKGWVKLLSSVEFRDASPALLVVCHCCWS